MSKEWMPATLAMLSALCVSNVRADDSLVPDRSPQLISLASSDHLLDREEKDFHEPAAAQTYRATVASAWTTKWLFDSNVEVASRVKQHIVERLPTWTVYVEARWHNPFRAGNNRSIPNYRREKTVSIELAGASKFSGKFLDVVSRDAIGEIEGSMGSRGIALTNSKLRWNVIELGSGDCLIQLVTDNPNLQKLNGMFLDVATNTAMSKVDGTRGGRSVVLSTAPARWRISRDSRGATLQFVSGHSQWRGLFLDFAGSDAISDIEGVPGAKCLCLTVSPAHWRIN